MFKLRLWWRWFWRGPKTAVQLEYMARGQAVPVEAVFPKRTLGLNRLECQRCGVLFASSNLQEPVCWKWACYRDWHTVHDAN